MPTFEYQDSICRDRAETLLPVRQLRRDGQLTLAAHLYNFSVECFLFLLG